VQQIVISGSGIHGSHIGPYGIEASQESIGCAGAGSLAAVEAALEQAKREPREVDALLVACPSADSGVNAESLRSSLGAAGWSWDLDIAGATATFGIRVASELLARQRAGLVVLVRPEPPPAHPDEAVAAYGPAGNACSAIVLERGDATLSELAYEVLGTRLRRQALSQGPEPDEAIAQHMRAHLCELDLAPEDLRRMWIHQENPSASLDIARGVLGRDADPSEAPVLVDPADPQRSAGSLVNFHLHKRDLWKGEIGQLCSIGPQGSLGSTVLRRWMH
jgi:beta-ketodecanoyl-[acyl-carrier-protein] synthase